MTRTLAISAVLLLAACGPSQVDDNKDGIVDGVKQVDNVSQVAPSTPVGSVSGRVTDTKFLGLEGADVVMVLGASGSNGSSSYKTTSDAEGNFAFANVPAGSSAQLYVSKTGYTTMRATAQVPANAGQFPLNDGNANVGNVVLLSLTGTIRFNVYASTGKPATGVKALLEVTPAGYVAVTSGTYGEGWGVSSFTGTVDAQGGLVFAEVPSPEELARTQGFTNSYTLTLSPYDENGDGQPESLGTVVSYTGVTLFTKGTQTLFLPDARTSSSLNVSASNVDTLSGGSGAPFRNVVDLSEPVYVVFNQPIIEPTLLVKVVAEDCATDVAVTTTVRNGNVLVITPTSGWQPGKEYNIAVKATGLDSGTSLSRTGYFFGGSAAAPQQLANTGTFWVTKAPFNTSMINLESGDTITVTFSTPVRLVGGQVARLFYNADINASGTIGGPGDFGEYNCPYNTGFGINPSEPTFDATSSTFTCRTSGYTTRYAFTASIPRPDGVPLGTAVKIIFPTDSASTGGYQTIWGDTSVGEVAGMLALAP